MRRLCWLLCLLFAVAVFAKDSEQLPDGVRIEGFAPIESAWLVLPTSRYDHAILGDGIEAAGVRVRMTDGRLLTYRLPDGSVFEDRYPRLHDVDGDGVQELVLVRSYLDRGAALLVLKIDKKEIRPLAESDPIGLPHRWLNPVGVGDFDQDGEIELAAVVTPHIGGVLTLYEREGSHLRTGQRATGFSNHRIGSRLLAQSTVADVNGDGAPDLVVPSRDFTELRLVGVVGGALVDLERIQHQSPIVSDIERVDLNGDGVTDLRYALANGEVIVITLPR